MKWQVGLICSWFVVAGTAQAQGVVNIYNSRHYGSDEILYAGFTQATGIQVNVVEGSHDALIQRLASEGENTQADILITVDAARLALAASQDLLRPVTSQVLRESVPEHLRDPGGLWYGISMRARVLIYAKDRVDPSELSTYEALAEPQFRGRILTRSSSNVYSQSLLGSLLNVHGAEGVEAWTRNFVANFARPPEGGDTDQIRAVAAGVGDIAISNTYYLGRLVGSDKPEDQEVAAKVAVFFPNQGDRGTHVNISGVGMTRHARNPENALKLMEYLVTEGQRYLADVNFEYPVNPTVAPHPVLQAFGEFAQDRLNAATYAANAVEAMKIADRAGWK